jgi:quinol monooxygenase YgiN
MIQFRSLSCALLLFAAVGTVAQDVLADSYGEQVTSSIRLKILPDKVAEFEGLVSQLVRDVHANEPGAKVYEIRRVKNQPLTYVYFLSFADQAAFERYSAADWHTQMSPKAVACLDGDPVFEDLESFY